MKLQDFHIEVADWSNEGQRVALLDLRETVFIHEQGVPEQRERDGLDVECWHVLARAADGQPIGCGRLSPAQHKIGRMAVLSEWRRQGVGVALLRELVRRAQSQGWPHVSLDAQVSALPFYEREGFVAYGEEFEDAGLPHRKMRRDLPPDQRDPAPLRDVGALPATTGSETADARLRLLVDTRHRLRIHVPRLGNDAFATPEELGELRRIGISGRAAQIRILLHDPAAALRSDHRLVALAQRLPSAIEIRTPVEEADLAYPSAYLLNDVGGYLFLPEADRPKGRAARADRASQVPLQQYFDEVWDRAEPARELHALRL
ncbi:MAG TPA: GNAT family N-acetyltransferase [Rhodanobacter sp.]